MEEKLDLHLSQIAEYTVGEVLGAGFFGEARIGVSEITGQKVAIKVETLKKKHSNQHLASEKRIYDIIHNKQKQVGFPMIYLYGTDPRGFNYMVMELLGPSLEQLRIKNGGSFSHWTVLQIAMASIRRIEKVHLCNILYRDVKPDNFCIGVEDPTIIYLVDFGISRELFLPDGSHYPYTINGSFFGTSRYMSINANEGQEQSRRDDLESLAYVIIYLIKGKLPWQGIKTDNFENKFRAVAKIKRQITSVTLCEGISDVYKRFLDYAKGLGYEDNPSYDACYSMFEAEMQSLEQSTSSVSTESYQLDWLKTGQNIPINQRIINNDTEQYPSLINQVSSTQNLSNHHGMFEIHQKHTNNLDNKHFTDPEKLEIPISDYSKNIYNHLSLHSNECGVTNPFKTSVLSPRDSNVVEPTSTVTNNSSPFRTLYKHRKSLVHAISTTSNTNLSKNHKATNSVSSQNGPSLFSSNDHRKPGIFKTLYLSLKQRFGQRKNQKS